MTGETNRDGLLHQPDTHPLADPKNRAAWRRAMTSDGPPTKPALRSPQEAHQTPQLPSGLRNYLPHRLGAAERDLVKLERRMAGDDQGDAEQLPGQLADRPDALALLGGEPADLAQERNRLLREIQKLRLELQLQPTIGSGTP